MVNGAGLFAVDSAVTEYRPKSNDGFDLSPLLQALHEINWEYGGPSMTILCLMNCLSADGMGPCLLALMLFGPTSGASLRNRVRSDLRDRLVVDLAG